jgi:hypothetical protein
MRTARDSFIAVVALLLVASACLASTVSTPMKYNVTITPEFGRGRQWTGNLTIAVNSQGAISGTYKSTTIVPDPFYSQHIAVSGHESGKQITMTFHMVAPDTFKIQGQLFGDNINATAVNQNGVSFNFLAQRLH